jgi:hypothetical protein
MSIEELRQFKCFENYSDEQAADTIQSIESLIHDSEVVFSLTVKSKILFIPYAILA